MKTFPATVRPGESLLAALYREGALPEAACGGHGRCRRCRVRIEEGPETPPGPEDLEQLEPELTRAGWRLACRIEAPGRYRITVARLLDLPDYAPPTPPASGAPTGLAVDLGTTTLGAALVDLTSGETLARAARPNPQAAYGWDVLARIRWARDPEHRRRLAELVRRGVAALLPPLLAAAGRGREDVRAAVFAGNAAMTLLALGRDPEALVRPPYEPGLRGEGTLDAGAVLSRAEAPAPARFLPAIGGHVGSDTTAAALAADLSAGPTPALLVDLGTNGEVVLATEDALFAASAAAGPAFEGGGIEHGSAAGPGAIERAEVRAGAIVTGTADGSPARSWCGSGVVEIAAALRETGALDESGRLRDAPDLPVPFSQADVREVQLAKGALAAAIRILAREAGISVATIRRVVLTGAFGRSLRAAPARRIGLVPAGAPIECLEGGALLGASIALTDLARARALAGRIRHVPLCDRADFEETFVASLALRGLDT